MVRNYICLGFAVFVLGSWGSVAEAVGSKTHFNRNASDHVVLEVIGGSFCSAVPLLFKALDFGVRNLPDGTNAPFSSPPPGEVLVVTDVDWQINSGTANSRYTLVFYVVNTSTFDNQRVFESTIQLNSSGSGGTTTSTGAGVVVSSATRICVDSNQSGNIEHILLRGYLAKDK